MSQLVDGRFRKAPRIQSVDQELQCGAVVESFRVVHAGELSGVSVSTLHGFPVNRDGAAKAVNERQVGEIRRIAARPKQRLTDCHSVGSAICPDWLVAPPREKPAEFDQRPLLKRQWSVVARCVQQVAGNPEANSEHPIDRKTGTPDDPEHDVLDPVEGMVITAYQVVANIALSRNAVANSFGAWEAPAGQALDLQMNLLNTYARITIPLMAQGTATPILVQHFNAIPSSVPGAAALDGAGQFSFMMDISLPVSSGPPLALFLFLFNSGWIQYLWPLVVASSREIQTAVVELTRLDTGMAEGEIPDSPLRMAGAIMVTAILILLIALKQHLIMRGIVILER